MKASLAFRRTLLFPIILTACGLAFLVGCSDPQAEQRATICKGQGVTGDSSKACGRSQEEYKQIMGPIMAQQEREEVAAFNAGLQTLPSRIIPKDRYEAISLEDLKSKHKCCFLDFTDATKAPKHPLFGKRYRIKGRISFSPTDFESKMVESLSLEVQDHANRENIWLDVDIESLSREERALIRAQCKAVSLFDDCAGEFFGVIGRVKSGDLEVIGLQIEYLEMIPRETKKAS